MKKIIWCIIFSLIIPSFVYAQTPNLGINAKSAVLMEAESGKILYEQNIDEQLPIASITKIMTTLLICEAIDSGKITVDDMVTVSERAMSMGGTTMFLEAGDLVSVDEMLKGIVVASANDGTVAMAEYIAGSEQEFVNRMNLKAKELGMKNTSFVNTNGLDTEGHYSSARDVAIMSAELLKYEIIFNYTSIWTDKVQNGKYEISNTNKLIRFYQGANGLKTGSTSKALCCLSATAKRDGMQLIAVVLGAPDSNSRFNGAKALLDYGFASFGVKEIVSAGVELGKVEVKGGISETVGCELRKSYNMLLPKSDTAEFSFEVIPYSNVKAPVYKGDEIGAVSVKRNGEEIDKMPAYANCEVLKKTFLISVCEVFECLYK